MKASAISGSSPITASALPRTAGAAGAVLWRRHRGRIEVALVHRPRYDDWSWPKGKLDRGESWVGCAAREVEEETGFRPRIGVPLPRARYAIGGGQVKEVRYWAAEVAGGDGELVNEIDEVNWLTPQKARERLTYVRDVLQLQAVLDADFTSQLRTWPLLVVRHADAVGRKNWPAEDWHRPLSTSGLNRAQALVPVLRAYDVQRVISSSSDRCLQTVEPYAQAFEVKVRSRTGLSEEGFVQHPEKLLAHTTSALERGAPAVICTHGPLLADLLNALSDKSVLGSAAQRSLTELAQVGMVKGEALVCQVRGIGAAAQIVTVERQLPR